MELPPHSCPALDRLRTLCAGLNTEDADEARELIEEIRDTNRALRAAAEGDGDSFDHYNQPGQLALFNYNELSEDYYESCLI